MLASINPLGERARGTTFVRTFGWYLIGSVAGGALVGAGLGLVGVGLRELADPSSAALAIAVVAVCVVGLALDFGIGGVRVPSLHRQVNENWLAVYRGWVYGLGFGFQLGLGFATVMTAAIAVMFAREVLSGSVLAGVVIGATFGVGRTFPLLLVHGAEDPLQLRDALRRVHALARPAERITRVAIATLGIAGIVAVSL